MGAENVGELEAMVSHEKGGHGIVLDLKDLTLVDQEAVSFLEAAKLTAFSSRTARDTSASGSPENDDDLGGELKLHHFAWP